VGRLVGYARVSTKDQEFDLQVNVLRAAGVEERNIFSDMASGAKAERSGLEACIKGLQEGDTLVVWRIDRLGKSISHLVKTVEALRERGIGFKSICDGAIDTTSASGELVFDIFTSLAQFERQLIQERVRAGLDAARARGRQGGRKPLSADDSRVKAAKKMSRNRAMTVDEICKTLRISRATYYRFLSLTDGEERPT
jgi:DNA invertase Pin-like site-specific DNA recombinase